MEKVVVEFDERGECVRAEVEPITDGVRLPEHWNARCVLMKVDPGEEAFWEEVAEVRRGVELVRALAIGFVCLVAAVAVCWAILGAS